MYGEVELVNKDIVAFQRDIGSDIGTVLDIFTEPDWGPEKTRQAVDETLHRTKEAASIKGEMKLAGVVQVVYPDQRGELRPRDGVNGRGRPSDRAGLCL